MAHIKGPFIRAIFVAIFLILTHVIEWLSHKNIDLKYVYTLRLIGPISYLGACYIRMKVIKCIGEKMTMYFRGLSIKSHSSGYEIGPINRSFI